MIRFTPRVTLFPYTTLFRSTPRPRSPGHGTEGPGPGRPGARSAAAPSLSAEAVLAAPEPQRDPDREPGDGLDRKSTRLNSSHVSISYAVFCLKKKTHVKLTS